MKYLFVIVLVLIVSSCSILRQDQALEDSDLVDFTDVEIELTDEEQRKFNYYFYEGTRFKAIGEPKKSFMYFKEALEIDTTCSACAFEISKLLLGNESFEEAENLMKRAVRFSPENPHYVRLLSRLYQNNNKGDKAVNSAKRLIESGNATIEDFYFVAQVQLENGHYEDAINSLEEIENRIGINEGLSFEKYQILVDNGDFKGAEKELKNLIEKFPGNGDYYVFLGDFFLEREKYNEAMKQYNKVFDVDEDNGKVHFSLANYYLDTNDTTRFKEQLHKAFSSGNIEFESKFRRFMPFVSNRNKPDNPLENKDLREIFDILLEVHPNESAVYGAYGNFLISIGESKRAMALFDEALDIDASQAEIWQEYLFLISSMDDSQLLLDKASESIKFFPEEPLFRLFHGVALLQLDKLQRSADTMEKGLKFVDDNRDLKGRLHTYLGDIYHSLEMVDKSFHHYEKALEIDENNIVVLNNYSYYLTLQGKDLDRAERMSSRTIELQPGNATYLDTYAWVLFKKERYNEAKFIIERAVDNMDEPNGVIIEHYGDILYKTGDIEGALAKWKQALELSEHSDMLKKKIEEKRYFDEEK